VALEVELGTQRLRVERDWTLDDLLSIGRTYRQLYSVLYPLQPELQSELKADGEERLAYLYQTFPWRGGYSAVNFYQSQEFLIPKAARPTISRIRIESPGFIEFGIAVAAAASVHRIVKSLTASAGYVSVLYNDIYRQMHERKLMRISAKREELALAKDQLEFAQQAQSALGDAMNLPEAERIVALADNPLAALKITLSLYRRGTVLSAAERSEKMQIEPPS
jgi:hypothetical protein